MKSKTHLIAQRKQSVLNSVNKLNNELENCRREIEELKKNASAGGTVLIRLETTLKFMITQLQVFEEIHKKERSRLIDIKDLV